MNPGATFFRVLRIYVSRQFLLFILFGGSAAMVNLASGWLLYGRGGGVLPYWVAVTVAATNGLLLNFALNYLFNFRYRGRSAMAQLRTFCLVALFGIALTAGLAVCFRRFLMLSHFLTAELPVLGVAPDFIAHVLSVESVTVYSYAAHRYFTFNVGFRQRARLFLSAKWVPLPIRAEGCR
jgi:putative flippase GtrA